MTWKFDSDRPIYSQIMEQFTYKIISGEYKPGEKLPPVREIAQDAEVNPNTMQKAFQEIERTGLLYTNRTAGRFVTEDKALIEQCKENIAKTKIEDFIKQMNSLGITKDEILDYFKKV